MYLSPYPPKKIDKKLNGEKSPSIEALRQKGVKKAWEQERELVAKTGEGTRRWTEVEKKELLETGKVEGYEGHHINNVKGSLELASEPDNVEFVKGRKEHIKKHNGNFRNKTNGELIKRRK